MRESRWVGIGVLGGVALAVMLGQASKPSPSLELRVADLEGRVSTLEARLANERPAPKPRAIGILNAEDLAPYLGSEDAQVIADDGTFLGDLTSRFGTKSIGNDVGNHGSSIAGKSMWNEVGRYGGEIATLSPFNEITSRPPKLLFKGEFVCYVTANTIKTPRVHPAVLRAAVREE